MQINIISSFIEAILYYIDKVEGIQMHYHNSPEYQEQLCGELSNAFNRLISETSTISRNKIIQKLGEIMKCDDKLFVKVFEKLLIFSRDQHPLQQEVRINKNTKQIVSSFLNHFIEKNLLNVHEVDERLEASQMFRSSGISLQISNWINSFIRVIDANCSEDFHSYKNSVIGIYVNMFLNVNQCSVQGIKKLVNTSKFYFGKQRVKIGLNIIEKVVQNPMLLKKTSNKDKKQGELKRFKKQQILIEIIQILIDSLQAKIRKVTQVWPEIKGESVQKQQKQVTNIMQMLTYIICQMNLGDYLSSLCSSKKVLAILKCYISSQFAQFVNDQYQRASVNFIFILCSKLINSCLQSNKLSDQQEFYRLILKMGETVWNRYIQKQPQDLLMQDSMQRTTLLYINESITNFIMTIIQMGGSGSVLDDGTRTSQFKGNQSYLISNFMIPICDSFKQRFNQSLKDINEARVFITSIKQLVEGSRQQRQQILGHLQVIEQPVLYSFTRIMYKLSAIFRDLSIRIKKIVRRFIEREICVHHISSQEQFTILQMLTQMRVHSSLLLVNNRIIFGLILNCLFSHTLMKERDWLIAMRNLPYKVSQAFYEDRKTEDDLLIRFLYLINFRLYMDDILDQPTSGSGLIYEIISILVTPRLAKARKDIQMILCIDIVEYYYKHFKFRYQVEQANIRRLLESEPNKYIISLQLQIFETYNKQIKMEEKTNFLRVIVAAIKQEKFNEKVTRSIVVRIFAILKEYLLTQQLQSNQHEYVIEVEKVMSGMIVHLINEMVNKPELIICSDLSCLYVSMISMSNRKQNFLTLLTKHYLEFLNIINCHLKNIVEESNTHYEHYERTVFKSVSSMVEDIDIHSFEHFNSELLAQEGITDLRGQGQLYYLLTFITLLCKQQYRRQHFQIFETEASLKKLLFQSIEYLQSYRYSHLEYTIIFSLFAHQIIAKVPDVVCETFIQKIMEIVLRQANRKNKLLVTDVGYLFRGKIYIMFVLLVKNKTANVISFIDKLKYSQVDENILPAATQMKIKSLFLEIFCNSRNYTPHYDLPLLITTLIDLMEFLVTSSQNSQDIEKNFKHFHSQFIHLYLKLMLESVERLYIYQATKTQEWGGTVPEQADVYKEIELQSLYNLVIWITRQPVGIEKEVKNNRQIFIEFVKFYQLLSKHKQKWLGDVTSKFVDSITMKNIFQICNQYGTHNLSHKFKNRKIYTIIDQQ